MKTAAFKATKFTSQNNKDLICKATARNKACNLKNSAIMDIEYMGI